MNKIRETEFQKQSSFPSRFFGMGTRLYKKLCFLTILCLWLYPAFPSPTDQTISGFINDESNGESLIGVNVFIKGTHLGTTSNKSGYYIINNVPIGKLTLIASYIGYEREEMIITISPGESKVLNVILKSRVIQGEMIEVVAERSSKKEVKTSFVKITPRELKAAPQIAEPDLMRMLQTLPGILTLSEFSSGLFIRGSTPDQNLILLDGTEVYNVNHLFGIFSTFDVDAIKQVDLMKGGFPAQYGGRMSSVLDITNMDGNQKKFQGKASIGLISAKTSLQGPVGKGSWFFSGRRTYIDYIINGAEKITSGEAKETLETIPDYYFYDTHFKLYQDLNHRNKIAFTLYKGLDNMKYTVDPMDLTFQWGNQAATGKWTHIFNQKLFINFYTTFSQYKIFLDEDDALAKVHFENKVDDITIRSDMEYFPNTNHTAKIGFVFKKLDSKYFQQYSQQTYLFISNSHQYSLYFHDNWTVSPIFNIQLGCRLNYYQPREFVNTFNRVEYRGKSRFDVEPRLAMEYRLTENTILKSSWGRYLQYVTIVPFGNADFSFMDIWFPCDNSYLPGEATHYIAGIETRLPFDIRFDWEIYYKDMPHVYESNPNANDVPTGKDLYYTGNGVAYGADFYVEKNVGRLSGWFSYSLGWTKRKFPELNNGRPFFPKYDRRHYLHLISTYNLTNRWSTNFAWTYGTGQAFTQPVSHYEIYMPDRTVSLVIGEERNVSRLPAYHRMDIGIRYNSKRKMGLLKQWSFYFQIYNVYNRRNIWFKRVDPEMHPPETMEIRMLPILPTFGFEFHF